MRDEEHGLRSLAPNALELQVHLLPRHRVQRAERLVHEQQAWVEQQGPAESHTLLHAARQLSRVVVSEAVEPDETNQIVRHRLVLPTREAAGLRWN